MSRPSEHKELLVANLLKSLVEKDRIQTTLSKAKEAQPMADRLITWGKEGSVHARRQAFRLLQDRALVQRLFTDIAPRFEGVAGGYTRVNRIALRKGDGATVAQLAFSRIPEVAVAEPQLRKGETKAEAPEVEGAAEEPGKKSMFEGLRDRLSRKKKGQ